MNQNKETERIKDIDNGITRRDFVKQGIAAGLGLSALSLTGFPDLTEAQKLAGSKAALDSTKATKGGTLRYRMLGDPPVLDPQMHLSFLTQMFAGQVYSRLLRYDFGEGVDANDRTLLPDLAEKWEHPDELTYKFYLKKGVKFHNVPPVNGRELVAEDVKFSLERHLNPAAGSPVTHYFSDIASIELPDKHTVIIKTKEPFAPMATYLGSYFSWILPKEVIEKDGDAKKTCIGTGPFILDEYVRNSKITFKKNPDYFWSGHPHVDRMEMLIIKDQSQSIAAFRSKNLEINFLYNKLEADELKKSYPEAKITRFLVGQYTLIVFNIEKPPFNNIKVRQAINHAIDRKAINESISFGESGFTSTIPPSMKPWALSEDEVAHLYRYDPDLAKKLLKEAGVPKGAEITLQISELYGSYVVDTASLFQEQLAEVGLKMVINRVEYGAFQKALKEGTYHFSFGPRTTFTEPDEWVYSQFHSNGSRNYNRARDKDLDKKLEAQRHILDIPKRKKLLDEIQRELAEKAYLIPINYGVGYYCTQPYVKNYGGAFYYGLSLDDTWLQKG